MGSVDIPPGTPDDIVRRRTSGYLCPGCSSKVQVSQLLANGRVTILAERLRQFQEKWAGKLPTKEAYQELFELIQM